MRSPPQADKEIQKDYLNLEVILFFMHLNVEIKAHYSNSSFIRQYLLNSNARFAGTDLQTDTYFNVGKGRMKLREGKIENALIHYSRENIAGPKASEVILYEATNTAALKNLLTTALGIKVVVKKEREIYFIDNVKFHVDSVKGLGEFVEIEAIDYNGEFGKIKLQQQCSNYMSELKIEEKDLVHISYSDMLLEFKPDD